MAKQPSKRSGGAGEAVSNAVPAQSVEASLPVSDGNGNVGSNIRAATKQSRSWQEHVVRIEETIRNSGKIATQLHGDFEGMPQHFHVDGYGLILHPSGEHKVVYSDGTDEQI